MVLLVILLVSILYVDFWVEWKFCCQVESSCIGDVFDQGSHGLRFGEQLFDVDSTATCLVA